MSVRLGLAALAPLFVSATAFAQAPGEVEPTYSQPPPPVVQPAPQPVVVDNPCGGCGAVDPMARRIAIGVNIGGMSVGADHATDAEKAKFHTAELSVRYRFTPHFELELLLAGGRQVLDNGDDGNLAMGGGTLAARYRFRPDRSWNWWLSAGLGMTVIENHDATQQQRDDAQRGHFAFGVGLEKRFRYLALHAELKGMALGQRSDQMDTTKGIPTNTAPPDTTDVRLADHLSAGQFTIGASLYF
jgi:outer membrane protein with beta-barrel domain